jgi:glycosyltransferase involved in cell wall biosynthesis
MNQKKRNILYIGGFELPDKNAAAQRVVANAKLFSTLGYTVSFFGVNREAKKEQKKKALQIIDTFSFDTWEKQYPTSNLEWIRFLTNISEVKKIVELEFQGNLDLIVVYNYPSIALCRLIRLCKKKQIKLVADVTEWYEPKGNILFRLIKGFDSFFRMRVLHNKLDGIIAISTYLFNYYNKKNSLQLPPLVDKNSKKWKPVKYNERSFKKIVYVGSPGNGTKDRLDKIILSLARIMDKLGAFRFVIVGITKQEYLNSFGATAIPEILGDALCFKGRKTHKEAIKEIKEADYSIFLRDNNLINTAGFPTKFAESITCNTPVLTNASSNIIDFLKNGELGYLLDISTDEKLDTSLQIALSKNTAEINYMKQQCELFEKFHYESYKVKFQQFLNNINLGKIEN